VKPHKVASRFTCLAASVIVTVVFAKKTPAKSNYKTNRATARKET
jgi:hypothetical protein